MEPRSRTRRTLCRWGGAFHLSHQSNRRLGAARASVARCQCSVWDLPPLDGPCFSELGRIPCAPLHRQTRGTARPLTPHVDLFAVLRQLDICVNHLHQSEMRGLASSRSGIRPGYDIAPASPSWTSSAWRKPRCPRAAWRTRLHCRMGSNMAENHPFAAGAKGRQGGTRAQRSSCRSALQSHQRVADHLCPGCGARHRLAFSRGINHVINSERWLTRIRSFRSWVGPTRTRATSQRRDKDRKTPAASSGIMDTACGFPRCRNGFSANTHAGSWQYSRVVSATRRSSSTALSRAPGTPSCAPQSAALRGHPTTRWSAIALKPRPRARDLQDPRCVFQ